MQALKEGNLTFPWRSSSPGHQPLRVSQPDVMGDHLPSAGLGLGSPMESSIPSLLRAGQREYSMVVIFLPLLDHCPEGVGSDQTTSRPLLPISMNHQLSYHFFTALSFYLKYRHSFIYFNQKMFYLVFRVFSLGIKGFDHLKGY